MILLQSHMSELVPSYILSYDDDLNRWIDKLPQTFKQNFENCFYELNPNNVNKK